MSTTIQPSARKRHPGSLGGSIASEWTKLTSVRSTLWTLLASIIVMAVVTLQMAMNVQHYNTDDDPTYDPGVVAFTEPAVSSIVLVQFVALLLALLAITSEYANGSIRSTLQWVPVRRNVLLAKAIVIAPVMFVLGITMSVVGALVSVPLLGEWGELDTWTVVADTVRIGVYLAIAGLFALGLGTVVRSTAGGLTTSFVLLAILPMMLGDSGANLTQRFGGSLPGGAGNHFLTQADDLWSPTISLGIFAAWAVVALLAGAAVLNRRDA